MEELQEGAQEGLQLWGDTGASMTFHLPRGKCCSRQTTSTQCPDCHLPCPRCHPLGCQAALCPHNERAV